MHDDNTTDRPPKKRPIILLVEEDNHARPSMTNNLRRAGYRLLVTADFADALEWVGSAHIPADLVLIDLVGRSVEETLSAGRRLREHTKDEGHTPLIALPEKFSQEQEGTDERVGERDWVCYYADAEQLHNLIKRLTNKIL
jgi:DNA-binding response OmpR family regulator